MCCGVSPKSKVFSRREIRRRILAADRPPSTSFCFRVPYFSSLGCFAVASMGSVDEKSLFALCMQQSRSFSPSCPRPIDSLGVYNAQRAKLAGIVLLSREQRAHLPLEGSMTLAGYRKYLFFVLWCPSTKLHGQAPDLHKVRWMKGHLTHTCRASPYPLSRDISRDMKADNELDTARKAEKQCRSIACTAILAQRNSTPSNTRRILLAWRVMCGEHVRGKSHVYV